jgi:hypothetical protein
MAKKCQREVRRRAIVGCGEGFKLGAKIPMKK